MEDAIDCNKWRKLINDGVEYTQRRGGGVQLVSKIGKRSRAAISCHLMQTSKESA